MRKSIAVILGGDSSEWKVSMASGKNIISALDRKLFDVYPVFLRGAMWRVVKEDELDAVTAWVEENSPMAGWAESFPFGADVDKSTFSCAGVKFDYAMIMIHGVPGETGQFQGYLEMMGVPFNTSSSYVCAVSFDKQSCKRFLDFAGVKLAKDFYLRREHTYDIHSIVESLGLPLFVKPTIGGSSFGITKVEREEDLEAAIGTGFKECPAILIEQGVSGREVTVGVYRQGGAVRTLPVTEIVSNSGWFDYNAKYLGKSREICPAPISQKLTDAVNELSSRIYTYMGCSGLVRMDYILRGEDIFFLEINSTPGMTSMSLVPGSLRASGIPLSDFLTSIIAESLELSRI